MYRIGEHINADGIWEIVWNWRDRMESVNGYKVSFQVDENILILGYGDFCNCKYTKNDFIVHYVWVHICYFRLPS